MNERCAQRARLQARILIVLTALAVPASAAAVDWPQEVTAEEGTIVVYQPQPESLDGNTLAGRAAMSLELNGVEEPIFGAFWFEARITTDLDQGTALIHDVEVTKVRWPDSNDAGEQRFTAVVEASIPESGFEISLERLSASLETADIERKSLENLNNDPPQIIFREELAVLLLYDGEPRYAEVENSDYERVLNAPMLVVRKRRGSDYWLSSGNAAKRTGNGWQAREGGQWSKDSIPAGTLNKAQAADRTRPETRDRAASTRPAPSTRPSTRPETLSRNIDRSGLDRAHSARQHGASRQQARPAGMNRGQRRR